MRTYAATHLQRRDGDTWRLRMPRTIFDLAGCHRRESLYIALQVVAADGLSAYTKDRFVMFISTFGPDDLKGFGYMEADIPNEVGALSNALHSLRKLAINLVECRSVDLGEATDGRVELLCSGDVFATGEIWKMAEVDEQLREAIIRDDQSVSLSALRQGQGSTELDMIWRPAAGHRVTHGLPLKALTEVSVKEVFTDPDDSDDVRSRDGSGVWLTIPKQFAEANLTPADENNYISLIFDSQTNLVSLVSRNQREINLDFKLGIPNSPGELVRFLGLLGGQNVNLRFVSHERDERRLDAPKHWAVYNITANISESKYSLFKGSSLFQLIEREVWWSVQRNGETKRRGEWEIGPSQESAEDEIVAAAGEMRWRKCIEFVSCEGTNFKIKDIPKQFESGSRICGSETEHAGVIRFSLRLFLAPSEGQLYSLDVVIKVEHSVLLDSELDVLAEAACDQLIGEAQAASNSNEFSASGLAAGLAVYFTDAIYAGLLARSLRILQLCCVEWRKAEDRDRALLVISDVLTRLGFDGEQADPGEWLGRLYRDLSLALPRLLRDRKVLFDIADNGRVSRPWYVEKPEDCTLLVKEVEDLANSIEKYWAAFSGEAKERKRIRDRLKSAAQMPGWATLLGKTLAHSYQRAVDRSSRE